MSQGVQTRKEDYQRVLEGVSYAQVILNHRKTELDELLVGLNNDEVLGGESGKEYIKRLQAAVGVIDAVIARYRKLAETIAKVCVDNGAHVDNVMLENFDKVQAAFDSKAVEVAQFKANGAKK